MPIDFKNDLNPEQYAAATSDAQYLRIIAGAGTGKTRTLTYRLAYLLTRGDLRPTQIVAITFTNKAANEMRVRTQKILDDSSLSVAGFPLIATFHGFCYRFLRRELASHYNGFTKEFMVADDIDQRAIFKKIADSLNILSNSEPFKKAVGAIHDMKTRGLGPEAADSEQPIRGLSIPLQRIFEDYQRRLAQSDLVDFDDLLIFTRDILLKDNSCRLKYQSYYRAFMIDEFQDTNDIQYEIVRLFMSPECQLCVVGDPDQTIYTWRGADNALIKNRLSKDFGNLETITLDINYRSTQKILDKANTLIKHNKNRIDKSLTAFGKDKGEDVEFISSFDAGEEAQTIAMKIKNLHTNKKVAYSDIAIIYRSNFLSRNFEKYLTSNRVPYKLYDAVSFYQRTEVKAGLAYMRLMINSGDNISFEKVLESPSRKIGPKTLESVYEQASSKQMPAMDYLLSSLDKADLTNTVKANLRPLISSYLTCQNALAAADTGEKMAKALLDYFTDSGLLSYIRRLDEEDNRKTGDIGEKNRENNLDELLTDFRDYINQALKGEQENQDPDLTGFLINVALMSSQDNVASGDYVSVMTGHVSKGLEFPYVFVTGLVDGIFPTSHVLDSARGSVSEAMEEERRLFYVAMTRAKRYLCLSTFAGTRFGGEYNLPSPFLLELGFKPDEEHSGFLSSMRADKNTSYASARKANSRFSDRSMFSQIDRYFSGHGYADDDEPVPYGHHGNYVPAPSVSHLTRTGYASAKANAVEYKIGDKIAHASFGVGTVTEVKGNRIVVDFGADVGIKTLIAGFKAFRKING